MDSGQEGPMVNGHTTTGTTTANTATGEEIVIILTEVILSGNHATSDANSGLVKSNTTPFFEGLPIDSAGLFTSGAMLVPPWSVLIYFFFISLCFSASCGL